MTISIKTEYETTINPNLNVTKLNVATTIDLIGVLFKIVQFYKI
jgi:hypothetical protein